MAAPAVAKPAKVPAGEAFAIVTEGTGAERKWLAVKLVLDGDRVVKREVLERGWHHDFAEDAIRRHLRRSGR